MKVKSYVTKTGFKGINVCDDEGRAFPVVVVSKGKPNYKATLALWHLLQKEDTQSPFVEVQTDDDIPF